MTCCDESVPAAWERPVFIITTGRSGSTLLLRYLNCAEGLVVWGEHAGVMRELGMAYRRLVRDDTTGFVEAARPWVGDLMAKRAVVCSGDQMTIEWVNAFDPASIRTAFRQIVLSLFTVGLPPSMRWGFKEIHYGGREINLMRALFAAPRFLILLRDPQAILKSKLKAFAKGNAAAMSPHIAETHAFFESVAEEAAHDKSDVLFIRYEELVAQPQSEIARIATFIDASFVPAAVEAICSERAGRRASTAQPADGGADVAERLGLAAFRDPIEDILLLDRRLDAALKAKAEKAAALAA